MTEANPNITVSARGRDRAGGSIGGPGIELELAYTFGGDFLSQEDALLAWVQQLLFSASRTFTDIELRDNLCKGTTLYAPIEVELEELRKVLARGGQKGHLIEDGGSWRLSEERDLTLRGGEQRAREVEAAVRADWLEELGGKYPDISFGEINYEVWGYLEDFIAVVLRRYGQQLASAAYENNGGAGRLDVAVEEVIDPEHPLYGVLKVELPGFVVTSIAKRQKYLGHLLSHALYAYRTSTSREAAESLAAVVRGQAIFLDTNVLFVLAGLGGEEALERSVRRFAEIARSIGFRLFYTRLTLDEYTRTLRALTRVIEESSSPPAGIVVAGPRARPGIVTAYYKLKATENLAPSEFYARYKDVEARLAAMGVTLEPRADAIINASVRGSDIFERLESQIATPVKSDPAAIDHDAAIIGYIAHLRAGRDAVRDAKAWFVTLDRGLPRLNRAFGIDVPLILTIDLWLATFRRIIPRVEDFDDFFAGIVTRTILPAFYLDPQALLGFQSLLASSGRAPVEVLERIVATADATTFSQAVEEGGFEAVERLEELLARSEAAIEQAREYAANGPAARLGQSLERERNLEGQNFEMQRRHEALVQEIQLEREHSSQQLKELRADVSKLTKAKEKVDLDNKRGHLARQATVLLVWFIVSLVAAVGLTLALYIFGRWYVPQKLMAGATQAVDAAIGLFGLAPVLGVYVAAWAAHRKWGNARKELTETEFLQRHFWDKQDRSTAD